MSSLAASQMSALTAASRARVTRMRLRRTVSVHLTAPALGVVGMQEHVGELLRENADFWCPQQFNNQMTPFMHEGTTGPEIWRQSKEKVPTQPLPLNSYTSSPRPETLNPEP